MTIMQIRKFFELHHNIARFRFFLRIAKRCICLPDKNEQWEVLKVLSIDNTANHFKDSAKNFATTLELFLLKHTLC